MDVVEDEKKPFDAETQNNEDDAQPDPDEHLMLDQGNGRVWLVKVPKFLMERWSSINAEDVHLATIRVYNPPPDAPTQKARIVLFLPPNRDPSDPNGSMPTPPSSQSKQGGGGSRPLFEHTTSYATPNGSEPDTYELEMVNENVENQLVVAERPKDPSLLASSASASSSAAHLSSSHPTSSALALNTNTRARTTILTGRIKHECNLRPAFSASYRKQMRERHRKYNTPTRQIMMIDDAGVPGGRGGVNRLSSGVGVGAGRAFGDLVRTKPKPAKGTFERMARMPRNQLMDQLFDLFQDTPRWSIKPLRERVQQPEAYLKEVLGEIAFLHKSGEWNGLWELTGNYTRGEGVKAENVAGPSTPGNFKMDEDEDDEDEDEDMEEVS